MDQLPYYVVIALGATCLLFGFFIIVRGIGVDESQGTFKVAGMEISTSKVGPGILFAMFGVFLIVVAVIRLPLLPVIESGKPVEPAEPKTDSGSNSSGAAHTDIERRDVPTDVNRPSASVSTERHTPIPVTSPAAASSPEPQVGPTENPPVETPPEGLSSRRKSDIVKSALNETANGNCPVEFMAERLLIACRQQVAWLGPQLLAAGPIVSVTYTGRHGQYEAYAVNHSNQRVIWLATFDSTNKLFAFLPAP
jgi:hypothetical protein